jgi:hypothetical protein
MKYRCLAYSTVLVFINLILSIQLLAQNSSISYLSHGYFEGLSLADSLITKDTLVITISQNKVEIIEVDIFDSSKNKLIFESRCLSPIKYPSSNGDYYTVWKLGDRKMILRTRKGVQYISLYQTDDYGLPKQYLTYKIEEVIEKQ